VHWHDGAGFGRRFQVPTQAESGEAVETLSLCVARSGAGDLAGRRRFFTVLVLL